MEKLKCDRCGTEYSDKESIASAKAHEEEWKKLCRKDGVEPRGLAPCPNITCRGELQLIEEA